MKNFQTGRWLLKSLLVIIVAVMAAHLLMQILGYTLGITNNTMYDSVNRFNVDSELSVPTWLASALPLIAALLAGLIAHWQKDKTLKILWAVLAAILLFIAIDETAALHELLLQYLHLSAGFGEAQTMTANAWLLILPVIAVGLLVLTYSLYLRLPPKTFRRFLLAGSVYLAGALMVEYLSISANKGSMLYNLVLTPIEEGLEFVGIWLVIWAELKHIEEAEPELHKRLENLRP